MVRLDRLLIWAKQRTAQGERYGAPSFAVLSKFLKPMPTMRTFVPTLHCLTLHDPAIPYRTVP